MSTEGGLDLKFFRGISSFQYLNVTQFLGALNDNIFKLLIVFFLIELKGVASASTILATVGAVFVLPFLIFSSTGGILADRVSKRTILVVMKAFEALLMFLAILAFYYRLEFFSYVVLFFLAVETAIFGPPKYSIIPEIVPTEKVSKANSILTSTTYIAIILGTFLASLLTDLTHKNFVASACLCFFIGILGFLISLGISKTEPQHSRRKIQPFFLYEVYKTLTLCYQREFLLPIIAGSAFFLFIGAFVQLNIIPFAMQSLHLSEVAGGYLFLNTAIGISAGALVAGKLSKEKVLPGLSSLAGFLLAFIFFLLFFFSSCLVPVILLLMALGVLGGMFVVPLDSFIQVEAPNIRRGQIIAATNFLSYAGVLLASLALYLINDVFQLSSAMGFAIFGCIGFIFTLWFSTAIADLLLPYLSQKILMKIWPYKLATLPTVSTLIILEKGSWVDPFVLFGLLPKLRILTIRKNLFSFPFFNGFSPAFGVVSAFKHPDDKELWLLKLAAHMKKKNEFFCLYISSSLQREEWLEMMQTLENFPFRDIIFAHIERERKRISLFKRLFYTKTSSTIYFTDDPSQKA